MLSTHSSLHINVGCCTTCRQCIQSCNSSTSHTWESWNHKFETKYWRTGWVARI